MILAFDYSFDVDCINGSGIAFLYSDVNLKNKKHDLTYYV